MNIQDCNVRQEELKQAENSRLTAELDCVRCDLAQQRQLANHSAEKCRCLEFTIASLEREKITLEEMCRKLNNQVLELQW